MCKCAPFEKSFNNIPNFVDFRRELFNNSTTAIKGNYLVTGVRTEPKHNRESLKFLSHICKSVFRDPV